MKAVSGPEKKTIEAMSQNTTINDDLVQVKESEAKEGGDGKGSEKKLWISNHGYLNIIIILLLKFKFKIFKCLSVLSTLTNTMKISC